MTQNSNQFIQTPEAGYLDLQTGENNVVTAIHLTGQATALVPGQTVKLADTLSELPSVQAAVIADIPWGVVVYNLKDDTYPANKPLEIARRGTFMYMVASAAIARGADVSYNPATGKVATQTSTNAIVGQAYDKATADGDVIRVEINPAAAPE